MMNKNPALVVASPCFRNTPVFFVQPEHQVTHELLTLVGHFFFLFFKLKSIGQEELALQLCCQWITSAQIAKAYEEHAERTLVAKVLFHRSNNTLIILTQHNSTHRQCNTLYPNARKVFLLFFRRVHQAKQCTSKT